MGFESDFDEKIDVIDLIINVLKDHEKKMDELVSRLERAESIDTAILKPLDEGFKEERLHTGKPVASLVLKKWTEFREQARSSEFVAYDSHKGCFKVSALSRRAVLTYTERIPFMEIKYTSSEGKAHIDSLDINSAELLPIALKCKLNCGLELKKNTYEISMPDGGFVQHVSFYIDPDVAKQWLAYQLEVDVNQVVEGTLKD
jgi:hypothetical protein